MAKQVPFTLFKNETADKLLASISGTTTGAKPKPFKERIQRQNVVKNPLDSLVVKVVASEDDGYYEVQEQIWNDTDADPALHAWENTLDTVTFTAKETSAATSVEVDSIHIIKPDVSSSGVLWLFTLGGGSRPYVKITTATDQNNYIGNVITPTSATVITTGVTIEAKQPTAGASLKVGTEIFSDLIDGIYYIEPSVFYGD
jgi:hypothetical protein